MTSPELRGAHRWNIHYYYLFFHCLYVNPVFNKVFGPVGRESCMAKEFRRVPRKWHASSVLNHNKGGFRLNNDRPKAMYQQQYNSCKAHCGFCRRVTEVPSAQITSSYVALEVFADGLLASLFGLFRGGGAAAHYICLAVFWNKYLLVLCGKVVGHSCDGAFRVPGGLRHNLKTLQLLITNVTSDTTTTHVSHSFIHSFMSFMSFIQSFIHVIL